MFALRAALGRFRPDYVPGLFGWWDASAGNVFDNTTGGSLVTVGNAEVKRLEDLSGNGYHLTGTGSNGAARLRTGPDGKNGLAVIRKAPRENNASSYGSNNAGASLSTNFGTVDGVGSSADVIQPFTIIFAGKIGWAGNTPLGGGPITTGSSAAFSNFVITNERLGTNKINIGSRYNGSNQALTVNRYFIGQDVGLSGGGSTETSLPLNSENYVVMAVLLDGANSRYSINGGSWTQFSGASFDKDVFSLGVLCDPTRGQNAHELAELCLYEENISDADRISVVSYLMDKWDIS